jgi:hypothetical protein
MQVGTLQDFLSSLRGPLTAAGAASKVSKDLEQACAALEPFRSWEIDQFATLLQQAEEYRRTGVLPVPAGKPARAKPSTTAATSTASVASLTQQIRQLEERLGEASVTRGSIEAELDRMNLTSLKKADAVALAKAVGVVTNSKTSQDAAVKGIRRMLLEQKEAIESVKI